MHGTSKIQTDWTIFLAIMTIIIIIITVIAVVVVIFNKLKGSVKEPKILIYFFFPPSLNGVLFPMFCLLVEGECHILMF